MTCGRTGCGFRARNSAFTSARDDLREGQPVRWSRALAPALAPRAKIARGSVQDQTTLTKVLQLTSGSGSSRCWPRRSVKRAAVSSASQTLGTALEDWAADAGLGSGGGAEVLAAAPAVVTAAHDLTRLSVVLPFWSAFTLTQPFEATEGGSEGGRAGRGGAQSTLRRVSPLTLQRLRSRPCAPSKVPPLALV